MKMCEDNEWDGKKKTRKKLRQSRFWGRTSPIQLLQSRFGDKPLQFQVGCPQSGTDCSPKSAS